VILHSFWRKSISWAVLSRGRDKRAGQASVQLNLKLHDKLPMNSFFLQQSFPFLIPSCISARPFFIRNDNSDTGS
jgi:hypothetical protein